LILVEDKRELMRKLGKKRLTLLLDKPLAQIPASLGDYPLALAADGKELVYTYDRAGDRDGVTALLRDIAAANISFRDLLTEQSSLEEIFVSLVREAR
jgi:ABC-2 type transport system ATP-binding protein